MLKAEVRVATTDCRPALSALLKLMQPLQPPTQSWKPKQKSSIVSSIHSVL